MGRPRTISESEAVGRSLELFWQHGYESTSVAALSEALEVGPSSLYNAFGSKESLFRRALAEYVSRYTGFLKDVTETEADVRPLIREFLRGAVRAYTQPGKPSGCLVMQSGSVAGPEQSLAASITLEIKAGVERQLCDVLVRAQKRGPGKLSASPAVLAKYLMATLRGLSQLAIDGASRNELYRVADVAAGACAGA